MMGFKVNARGLKVEEIQEAIDTAIILKELKSMPINELLTRQEEAFKRLIEIVPTAAKRCLEVIKKKYPDMVK